MKEGRFRKEGRVSMKGGREVKEGRKEGRKKRRKAGRKERNRKQGVPTQYFRENAPDAKEGKEGSE